MLQTLEMIVQMAKTSKFLQKLHNFIKSTNMKQIARYTTVSIKGILKICLLIFVKNHFVKNQLERQALNKVAEERRTGTL